MKGWACDHRQLTSEDETGRAICVDCNGVVNVRLTREMFDAVVKKALEKA